jgi:hypothetical protein
LAVAVWVVALLIISVRVVAGPRVRTVFPIYTHAGENWVAGADLYEFTPGIDVFRYSPGVAALFVPWQWLPLGVGGALWRLVNAGVFFGALAWWARAAVPRPYDARRFAALLLLVAPMAGASLNNGQINLLLTALMVTAVTAVAVGRWNLAAAALTLSILLKLYPLALALLLVAAYPRKLGWRLALGLALGLALPFALQRPGYVADQYAYWWHHVSSDDRGEAPLQMAYRDLRLLFRVWLVPMSLPAYHLVQLASGAALAVLALAGRRAGWPAPVLATRLLAVGCCWMTALGPATESSTYTLLAPSLAAALVAAWSDPGARVSRRVLTVGYGLFVVVMLAGLFPRDWRTQALGPQPVGALLLLGVVLAESVRDLVGRRAAQAVPAADLRAA